MTATPSGLEVFGASQWVSQFLGRLGFSVDPDRTSVWNTLLVVAVISAPPLLLSVLSGTAWGTGVELPFFSDVNTLVRLFVVVPVLVIAARAVGIQLGTATQYLHESALIGDADRTGYLDARGDLARRADSLAVELVLLASALVVSLIVLFLLGGEPRVNLSSWIRESTGDPTLSLAGWWFVLISRPLVGFFLVLWAWRYLVWSFFLLRVGRLDLELQPAHPDLVGGLAPLVRAHASFLLVGFAVNSALSGAIANDILYDAVSISQVRLEIAFFTVISVVVLAVPLFVFTPGLIRAKNRGIIEYGKLAHELTLDFDARWQTSTEEKLLDTADPSAMADFSADYGTVQSMRMFPLGLHQLAAVALFLFLPFGALALTQVSPVELLKAMASKVF